MKRILTIIAICLLCTVAQAADTEAALAAFNKQVNSSNAERFFSGLEEEGFLDETIAVRENMSHDSLCAMVWY